MSDFDQRFDPQNSRGIPGQLDRALRWVDTNGHHAAVMRGVGLAVTDYDADVWVVGASHEDQVRTVTGALSPANVLDRMLQRSHGHEISAETGRVHAVSVSDPKGKRPALH